MRSVNSTKQEARIKNAHNYKHQAQAHIRSYNQRLILSSGQPLRHLDFPTRPNRQTSRAYKPRRVLPAHAAFSIFFLELGPVP